MSLTRIASSLVLTAMALAPAFAKSQEPAQPKRIEIEVTAEGFSPSRVEVEPGKPVRLVFTRRSDKTCATEVAVPSLKIKKALPLNEPVPIDITPEKEDVSFSCGMNMLKGTLVVK